jgi:undecaprenyl-diphosphatase
MTTIQSIILGVVQGLTEFLPISSSGHLLLFYDMFGIKGDTLLLSIIFHVATLLAVLIYYRKEIIKLIKNPFCSTNKKIVLTTIFTVIIYLLFKKLIDSTFNGDYLFIFFIFTAVILYISDYVAEKNTIAKRQINLPTNYDITNLPITYKQAIIIGLSQGFACIPGISRSGTTIATARIMGIDNSSTTFSFLISIPIIIGSLILNIIEGGSIGEVNIIGVSLGFIFAFIIGLLAIKLMVNLVKKCKLIYFSYYLLILSTFLILNDIFFKLF